MRKGGFLLEFVRRYEIPGLVGKKAITIAGKAGYKREEKVEMRAKVEMAERLYEIYQRLVGHFGPRSWWPAESPFEVIVGAILTQAVSWRNVEKAINNLKEAGLLTAEGLFQADSGIIEELIKPTRYYRMKTRKLRAFLEYLFDSHEGSLEKMFKAPPEALRHQLLGIYGLGEETVDCILLYAGGIPIFVVDEYTRRVYSRLGIFPQKISYRKMQEYFHKRLPLDGKLFNDYHAQIVALGHHFCKKSPLCADCPLREICLTGLDHDRSAEERSTLSRHS